MKCPLQSGKQAESQKLWMTLLHCFFFLLSDKSTPGMIWHWYLRWAARTIFSLGDMDLRVVKMRHILVELPLACVDDGTSWGERGSRFKTPCSSVGNADIQQKWHKCKQRLRARKRDLALQDKKHTWMCTVRASEHKNRQWRHRRNVHGCMQECPILWHFVVQSKVEVSFFLEPNFWPWPQIVASTCFGVNQKTPSAYWQGKICETQTRARDSTVHTFTHSNSQKCWGKFTKTKINKMQFKQWSEMFHCGFSIFHKTPPGIVFHVFLLLREIINHSDGESPSDCVTISPVPVSPLHRSPVSHKSCLFLSTQAD